MNSALALGIILTFVFLIVFILIAKNDLGVISLTNQKSQDATLIGKISTGFPGSNPSQSQAELPITTNGRDVIIQSLNKEGSNLKTQVKSSKDDQDIKGS